MRSRLVAVGLVAALVLVLSPALARAEGTVCGFETVLVPDGRIVESTIPGSTTFWFLMDLTSGRSYSVEIKSRIAQWGVYPGTATFRSATDSCGAATLVTTNTINNDPKIPNTARRVSFIATAGGFHRIELVNSSASAIEYSITISETTQFSPGWSTNGSYDSFYSLYNTTSSTITGTLTLFNTAGTAVTTQPVTIAAGATTSTNTSAMGTVRNTTGTARLTHNGPPGAILAEAAIANFTISPTPYFQFIHFEPTRDAAH